MRPTWTIARREVKALFDQPTAYILLVVFTGLNGFLFFREADLYGAASLRPMLDLLPWLLLFLVPAVTMRALETRSPITGSPPATGTSAIGRQSTLTPSGARSLAIRQPPSHAARRPAALSRS